MEDIKSFVLLKYEMITSDSNTWSRLEKYPESVKSKWAWRCAEDVEHHAEGYPEAEECIRVCKLHRDGKATEDELDVACQPFPLGDAFTAVMAARSTALAAYATRRGLAAYAAYAATKAAPVGINEEEKWKLYISWLIEELCDYENNKNNKE